MKIGNQKINIVYLVNKQVITGSLYRDGYNKVNVTPDDQDAERMAQDVANGSFQPDASWAVDICKTKSGAYYVLYMDFLGH